MKRFTIKQYAGMINDMSRQGLLFYVAGRSERCSPLGTTIKESRDLWRSPANMALLDEDAKQAARHYIKTGGL